MKTAIVTGAASGIGLATATLLWEKDWNVVAADLNANGLAQFVDADPTRRAGCAGDVSKASDAQAIVDTAIERFGQLDALINIAGIEIDQSVDLLMESDWDRVVDSSLKGTYLCSKAAIPELRRAGGGSVVNTGSALGRASMPKTTAYSASKAGIEALTRTMALDHAVDRIRVNCVLPGITDTPLVWGHLAGDELAAARAVAAADVPLGFIAQPRQIAEVYAFLISPAAEFITGASLVVDGGTLARLASRY